MNHPTAPPIDQKTDPNWRDAPGRSNRRGGTGGPVKTAVRTPDYGRGKGDWYTTWVAHSILRAPRHAAPLAASLLDEDTAPDPHGRKPDADLGSEYYLG